MSVREATTSIIVGAPINKNKLYKPPVKVYLTEKHKRGDGKRMAVEAGYIRMPDFDLAKYEQQVKDVLEPLGMWKPGHFGIYVVWDLC